MGPTWGPPGSCRPKMGPMLAPWILLSGYHWICNYTTPYDSVIFTSCLNVASPVFSVGQTAVECSPHSHVFGLLSIIDISVVNHTGILSSCFDCILLLYPDSKVHGANMGPIWGWQDPDGPHVGPMKFAIWVVMGNFPMYLAGLYSLMYICIPMICHRICLSFAICICESSGKCYILISSCKQPLWGWLTMT